MGVRAADVSAGAEDGYPRFEGDWRAGPVAVDPGLSARRPALLAGRAAADADSRAVGGAAGQSGRRRRRVQLAVALCGAGGRVGADRRNRRR